VGRLPRLAAAVVNSLEKSVQAICDGRFELISEVEDEEIDSDRREVQIEQSVCGSWRFTNRSLRT